MTARFPTGFRVRIRDDVRRVDERLLIGGSPIRSIRLSDTALALVDGDRIVTVSDRRSEALAALLVDGNVADPVLTGAGVAPEQLTVVIPVRDRPEQLDRALAGLTGLSVLVVDDASLHPEPVAKVAADHGAALLRLERNVGPASARNAGLAEVRTPYVAFVDSDMVADAAMLRRLTRHFADDRVALVGPLVRSRARGEPHWFERYDVQVSSLALGSRACSVRPGAAVGWLPSACLVGRTDRLRPGFTEGMRVGEDVDLVWRLVDAGQAVRYDPAETAWHDTRDTVRGWLGRKFLYGTGGAVLAARHGAKGAPAVLTAPMGLAAAGVLAARWWSPLAAAAGLAYGYQQLDRRLPASPGRRAEAARLSASGLGWAIRQEAALLLRHWWPAAAAAAAVSPSVRRAIAAALVVDVVVARIDHPAARYAPVSRRLDDLAYGAGLWVGAARARSVRCLFPRRPASPGNRAGSRCSTPTPRSASRWCGSVFLRSRARRRSC